MASYACNRHNAAWTKIVIFCVKVKGRMKTTFWSVAVTIREDSDWEQRWEQSEQIEMKEMFNSAQFCLNSGQDKGQ